MTKAGCTEDWHGILKYNVYYPDPNIYNYNSCPLKCMIFVHGGGYSDCSSYVTSGELVTLLREMARRGFVVYNVEYRRGRILDNPPYTSVQQELSNYRVAQDIRGVIRTIIYRQTGANPPAYKADMNNILLAGNSGGAIAVLTTVFYQTQNLIDQVFPKAASSSVEVKDVLGPIDADYYAGAPTIEYVSRIKCILNLWGGVPFRRMMLHRKT